MSADDAEGDNGKAHGERAPPDDAAPVDCRDEDVPDAGTLAGTSSNADMVNVDAYASAEAASDGLGDVNDAPAVAPSAEEGPASGRAANKRRVRPPGDGAGLLDLGLDLAESSDDSDFRIEDHPDESDDCSIDSDDNAQGSMLFF